ncbi:hypothetical protein AQUCO_00900857v1 [Aquilegia coerulea]|uniref:RST domain-containing protein n=1 Tax=Aquilegia coerulea TaxID=218851 RepID=A0A2G5EFM8_AQUCA|nr:hypothetical protein AQUCO_00900857v1 [Aquilegia coerulea]PIA54575.1 hypothetical protein AQUCO_00900857v1 [Aquilegia coerulea]
MDIDRLSMEFDELLKVVFAMPEDDDEDMHSQAPDDDIDNGTVDVIQIESCSEIKDQKVDSSHKHSQLEPKEEQNPNLSSPNSGFQISQRIPTSFGDLDRMRQPENQHQYPKLQKMDNKHALVADSGNRNKPVSLATLFPLIVPHLDRDRAIQLQTLYTKLRKNEIHKDGFLRHLRSIVGEQMLRQAIHKIQTQGMHSEVNVESFAAALNRNVEGDTSISQLPQSDTGVLPQGRQSISSRSLIQKQDSSQEVDVKFESKEANSENHRKRVSLVSLLPLIVPHLDKDRAMHLQMLYSMLRKNEIGKDIFLRDLRSIVGDQMLRRAVHKIQMQL